MSFDENLVVIIVPSPGIIGRSWRFAAIGIEFFPQWRVLCKRNRIGRAGFGAVNPAVGSIDILAADGHNSPCNASESVHDFTCILLDYRSHVQYDIRSKTLKISCMGCKGSSITQHLLHSRKSLRPGLTAMKERDIVTLSIQITYNRRPYEARAANNQNAHLWKFLSAQYLILQSHLPGSSGREEGRIVGKQDVQDARPQALS